MKTDLIIFIIAIGLLSLSLASMIQTKRVKELKNRIEAIELKLK